MILLDTSPVFHSSVAVMARTGEFGSTTELSFLRHLFLNQIRSFRSKFHKNYGELVLALDSRSGYWRKELFPFYKAQRKEMREHSLIDWKTVFAHFDIIIQEMRDFFPYKIVQVDKAEADDIIAVLSKEEGKHLIVSNDKDFRQLHRKDVSQFLPGTQKKEQIPDPETFLFEQICRGDKIDGIPNIRSAPDSFVKKVRQKPCTESFITSLLRNQNQIDSILSDEELQRWKENKKLIDLSEVPDDLKEKIHDAYTNAPVRGRNKLFEYLASRNLMELCNRIGDF